MSASNYAMTVADLALWISVLSLVVSVASTISRSIESKSTRRISVFTASVDKYVTQICDSFAAVEKLCADYSDKGDYTVAIERKAIYDACNRSRRLTASFLNTILANKEFDLGLWSRFDDLFDEVMDRAEIVRSGNVADIYGALDEIQTKLSTSRAVAYSKRDTTLSAILTV